MSDAAKHLAMVVKALDAKKALDHDGYKLSVRAGRFKKRHFLVRYGQVLELDRLGCLCCLTCYQYNLTEDVPWQEVVASALLLLHHDPTLFDKWRNQRGKRWGA